MTVCTFNKEFQANLKLDMTDITYLGLPLSGSFLVFLELLYRRYIHSGLNIVTLPSEAMLARRFSMSILQLRGVIAQNRKRLPYRINPLTRNIELVLHTYCRPQDDITELLGISHYVKQPDETRQAS